MKSKNPLFHQGPTTSSLTPKQKKLLDYVTEFSKKKGYAPSQVEIAKHFGFSSLGTVQNYLVRLQKNGFLQKTWNAKRSLHVAKKPFLSSATPLQDTGFLDDLELPLLGKVAAGLPIEAVTSGETLSVPRTMRQKGNLFALKVQGNSMIEDGILDGDYVIIRKQATAINGQTIVAMISNEATIKRFFQKKTHIELHPANMHMKPIVVTPDDPFRIEGVLVGVIRHF